MKTKNFYVCSYGGSGSYMLCDALRQFGNVEHIHSRFPPEKLEYIGNNNGGNAYSEWFNGIPIPDNEIKNYYVIYIYRNPSLSIMSRFTIPEHLNHIQIDETIQLQEVLDTGKDLYKLREFYDNYTNPSKKRNYRIYCVKYEDIFDKQDKLSKLFGIGKLNLVNHSTRTSNERLNEIYADLIERMNKNNWIIIY